MPETLFYSTIITLYFRIELHESNQREKEKGKKLLKELNSIRLH